MRQPEGLTVKQASERSGYNPEYIRRLIRTKKLQATLIGQMWFISSESLEAYLEDMRQSEDSRAGPKA
jgi:excisionase family DNA binding protein